MFVLALSPPALAEGWGTLKGRIVVEGPIAQPQPHDLGNDPVCHAAKPVDERVLVGKQGGLQNAVVSLRPARGEKVAVHPELAKTPAKPIAITNRQCAFIPRVSILRTGQTLVVKNDDPTNHNTKFDLVRNTAINQVIPAKSQFDTKLEQPERLPMPISCNVHPFMRGYLMVREDPYAVVTDNKGKFKIERLPAGEHQIQFWHETGYLKHAQLKAGQTDRRGRVRLTIPAEGVLDLGDVRVPAELLVRD